MSNDTGNGKLLAENNLRVVHIRKRAYGQNRDITVAYRQLHNSSLIEVATAITNPKDFFEKKVGTQQAVKHFLEGKTIMLNNGFQPEFRSTVEYLQQVFRA